MPDSALELLRRQHDQLAGIRHVGVLVPWANTVVETELPRLDLPRVIWHYARLTPAHGGTALTDDFLVDLVTAVPTALHQLSQLPLDLTLLACTSAGFSYNAEPPRTALLGRPPVVSDAFVAVVSALRQLNAQRVVLLTPYPEALTIRQVAAFNRHDIAVQSHASLGMLDNYADVKADAIAGLLDRLDESDVVSAEAVVLSCTGWPTLPLLAGLEARLGRPVVSSNLAMAIAGLTRRIY